ncbi:MULTISPECIES: hypothetical protein [unclassified Streptomyces]|uniref:hypothetical protein n=1 Tax=unclassified Streptomyces TaxID=2593676 RepID=UPI0013A6C76A|nr:MULTISPECIES: hypothetical protein [unclassified Streptomyces]
MAEQTSGSSNGQGASQEPTPATPATTSTGADDYPVLVLKSITAGAGKDPKRKKSGR